MLDADTSVQAVPAASHIHESTITDLIPLDENRSGERYQAEVLDRA